MPTLEPGLGRTKIGRFWVYTVPREENHAGIAVYQYTPNRKGEHPQGFLKHSKGYLQTDAFSGFNNVLAGKVSKQEQRRRAKIKESGGVDDQPTLTSVGCWSHVRRKFMEALTINPQSIAIEVVELIQQLYQVEAEARSVGYTPIQRKASRASQSRLLLEKIHTWLLDKAAQVTPKSPLGKAIGYALNQWPSLTTFLEDGRLEIDNNRAERGLKPIAIGRKNYLFMGGQRGGEAAAVMYTLVETCKLNHIDPLHYFADVLERIPTHPNKDIQALLPQHWVPSHPLRPKAPQPITSPPLAA